jgi:hypothetical protein
LAIFVYTWWSLLFFNVCNQTGKSTLKHPSTSRSMSQKIMIHHELGNCILFKLYMETSVFNIAIRETSENTEPPPRLQWQQVNNVLLYHGKYLCNNQIASLAQFIDTCFYKEKKWPILRIFKLVLPNRPYSKVNKSTRAKVPVIFSLPV